MSLPQVQLRGLRTRELRELLEDEDKIHHIISCSEKFQGLQSAVEKMLASNQRLAKFSLSQKTKFRDAKLLLAMKYKELERRRSIIQAKQEQLAEKYSVYYAQLCLLKKINHAEEECELLFQRFAKRKMQLADFLDSFLNLRGRHHIRLIEVKKLEETIQREETSRLREFHPEAQGFSVIFPEQVHNPCLPAVCSLTTAVFSLSCCHPALLPFGDHGVSARYLSTPHLPMCFQSFCPGEYGRGPKRPTVPVRLEPLKVKQRRHQQAPQ